MTMTIESNELREALKGVKYGTIINIKQHD